MSNLLSEFTHENCGLFPFVNGQREYPSHRVSYGIMFVAVHVPHTPHSSRIVAEKLSRGRARRGQAHVMICIDAFGSLLWEPRSRKQIYAHCIGRSRRIVAYFPEVT